MVQSDLSELDIWWLERDRNYRFRDGTSGGFVSSYELACFVACEISGPDGFNLIDGERALHLLITLGDGLDEYIERASKDRFLERRDVVCLLKRKPPLAYQDIDSMVERVSKWEQSILAASLAKNWDRLDLECRAPIFNRELASCYLRATDVADWLDGIGNYEYLVSRIREVLEYEEVCSRRMDIAWHESDEAKALMGITPVRKASVDCGEIAFPKNWSRGLRRVAYECALQLIREFTDFSGSNLVSSMLDTGNASEGDPSKGGEGCIVFKGAACFLRENERKVLRKTIEKDWRIDLKKLLSATGG